MPDSDVLAALHSTTHCYLSNLEAAAHAMAEACPEVGKPYGQRLSRMRARLAFDSGVQKIEESCAIAQRELLDFARKTQDFAAQQRAGLRQALAALEGIVGTLAQRQEYYGERLRRAAAQLEKNPSAEAAEQHAAAVSSCAESMSHESQSLLHKMREELEQLETRLTAMETTDPVTGLINRHEMERSIAAFKARGETPILLLFDFQDGLPDDVARQAAARLSSQFRHHDLISRWNRRQFLVLFKGPIETARLRSGQILPWIAGRYQLPNGVSLDASVEAFLIDEARLAEPELTRA